MLYGLLPDVLLSGVKTLDVEACPLLATLSSLATQSSPVNRERSASLHQSTADNHCKERLRKPRIICAYQRSVSSQGFVSPVLYQ